MANREKCPRDVFIIDTHHVYSFFAQVYGFLLVSLTAIQFELYLDPLNTVARRVPTLFTYALGAVGCVVYLMQSSLRSFWAFNLVTLYYISIYLSYVFGGDGIFHLDTVFPEEITLFSVLYRFPALLTKVFVVLGFVLYLVLLPLLLVPNYRVRAVAMVLLFLFNAIDGGIFETNTAFDPCYNTGSGNLRFMTDCVVLTLVLTSKSSDLFYSLLLVWYPERCSAEQLLIFLELKLLTKKCALTRSKTRTIAGRRHSHPT